MRWTEEQFKAYMKPEQVDEPESALQSKIFEWATVWGFPVHSHPKSKAYFQAHTKGAGWPDITLVLKNRVLFLECKSKTGLNRKEQTALALILMHQGHEYHVVRTFKRFLEIVDGKI